jgi:TonB-dependent starch-binding outer membrane protein SusC
MYKSMKKNDIRHLLKPVLPNRLNQLLLIMKLIVFILLISMLQAHSRGFGQPNVTLNIKNAGLSKIFSEIEKKTNFKFLYNNDVFPNDKKYTVNISNQPLNVLLDNLFKSSAMSYKLFDNNLVAIGSSKFIAAQVVITGSITSPSGEPLANVTVRVKGSNVGTASDADGRFSITAAEDAVLVFSSVGYITAERSVKGISILNVILQVRNDELDQVVVVGYGTQRKKEVSSSISTVRASDIKDLRVTSLDQALQGKVAGVQVTNNTGAPGSFVQIRVRGTTSLSAGNEPLYVVDGVPVNNTLTGAYQAGNDQINGMASINPADIESMEILKDAAAAAIYGARAANGVVLITTKRGKPGKSTIGFNLTNGLANQTRRYDLLNAQQYAIMANELQARVNPGRPPIYAKTPENSTNWQDEIFTTGRFTDANLSFAGGSDKIQYSISGGLFDQKGTVINSRFRRYSFRSNFDLKINDRVKIGTNLYFARTINNRLRNDGGPNFQDAFNGNNVFGPNIISSALVFNPTFPVFNPDGTYTRDTINGNSNPVALATEANLVSKNLRLIGNFFGEWSITKSLKFRTNLGLDLRTENEDFFFPPNPAALGSGRASSRSFNEQLNIVENTLNYKKELGRFHALDALAGFTVQQSSRRSSLAIASGLTNNVVQTVGGPLTSGNSGITSNGILSYIGRANYNFSRKYYVSLAARVDASSRFGADNKYAFFPSVSVGWIVSDENFLKENEAIDFLKIRASYGTTGNQEYGDFDYLGIIAITNPGSPYLGQLGATPQNIDDNRYSWERTRQFNIGFDLSLVKNRFNIIVDYYKKQTDQLILFIPLPSTTGFGGRFGNAGSLQNKGIEFTLNTNNLTGKLKWNTSFNISSNKIKIVELVNGQDITQGSFGYSNIAREGRELSFFLYQTEDKVDAATGKMLRKDITKDGQITSDDRSIVGSPLPKHIGGITNTFQYKGFDASIFFQWSYGNKIYNATREFIEGWGSNFYNTSTAGLRRWKKAGDVTDVPFIGNDNNSNGYVGTRFLEDGSYLRLKNITLGYNFSGKLLKNVGISGARFYVSAQNLITFTNYTGFDPEVNHFTGNSQFNNIALGFDNASYPQAKTIVTGLSINL